MSISSADHNPNGPSSQTNKGDVRHIVKRMVNQRYPNTSSKSSFNPKEYSPESANPSDIPTPHGEIELLPAIRHGNTEHINASDVHDDIVPPPTAQPALQRWNQPRGNIFRIAAAYYSFMLVGLGDASIGALIPYLESYYELNYTVVSLIFLTPFAGYSLAAFLNASIHARLGQRGISIMAPICHIITYVVISLHPPFPVLVVANGISGFGNGLVDAAYSAWAGGMANANAIQGCLHACYSVGCTISPLIATSMVAKHGLPWWTWFYVMSGAAALELVVLTTSFINKTGAEYRLENPHTTQSDEPYKRGTRTKAVLKSKIAWLCSLYFFTYMGLEIALGGWIVTFMLRVRNASPYNSGVSATGFWAGMTVGRACLGFVTEKFGERRCMIVYITLSIGLELIFWLVPRFVVSAIAVSFLGMFLGPLFPGVVVLTAKLLPKHLHVSTIGFGTAIGGAGGTVFPFMVGAIAASKGVAVLQPIVLSLLVVLVGILFCFPKINKEEVSD